MRLGNRVTDGDLSVAADGVVFAAALNRGDDSASSGDTPTASIVLATTPPPGPTATPAPPATRRSQVYRIDATGAWESVWETTDLIYDVSATDDGGALVATGPKIGSIAGEWLVSRIDSSSAACAVGYPKQPALV